MRRINNSCGSERRHFLHCPPPPVSIFLFILALTFRSFSKGFKRIQRRFSSHWTLFYSTISLSLLPSAVYRVSSYAIITEEGGNRRSMVAVYLSRSRLIIIIVVDIMAFGSFFFFLIVDLFDNFDSSE